MRPRSNCWRYIPPEYVESVREHCQASRALDADTPVVPASWEAGLRAAGAACALVDALLDGTATTGFCGLRPPGHHAEPARAMGFCLFANAAVAAEHALRRDGVDRVFILDWDVHHGNGTHAVFQREPTCCSSSLHQWPFYPGTGALATRARATGWGSRSTCRCRPGRARPSGLAWSSTW